MARHLTFLLDFSDAMLDLRLLIAVLFEQTAKWTPGETLPAELDQDHRQHEINHRRHCLLQQVLQLWGFFEIAVFAQKQEIQTHQAGVVSNVHHEHWLRSMVAELELVNQHNHNDQQLSTQE